MSYYSEVIADSPVAYWRMNEASSPLASAVGGPNLNVTGGTFAQAGATTELGLACSFNGSSDFAISASTINMSASDVMTLEAWFLLDSAVADDRIFCFGTNGAAGEGESFIGTTTTRQHGSFWTGSSQWEEQYWNRQSTGAWHHMVVVMNRQGASTADFIAYVDTAVQTQTQNSSERVVTGNWGTELLTVMAFGGGSSGWCAGDMQHLALYTGELSSARVTAHYDARNDPETPWEPEEDSPAVLHTVRSPTRLT